MCLIAFAWGASERYPFVVVANRDEFFERPTAPLSRWMTPLGVNVVSGRDLRDGGTWTGFTEHGRFAFLTNVRQPCETKPPAAISRGQLVLDWLQSEHTENDWLSALAPQHYQGFNLIVGDWNTKSCSFVTNQSRDQLQVLPLAAGAIYGLSNASLDTPWPKTRQLKRALAQNLSQDGSLDQLIEQGLHSLLDSQTAADGDLPQTGVTHELEKALSSVFVRYPANSKPQYGTRSSLVAVHDASTGLHMREVTHGPDGMVAPAAAAHLPWPAQA